MIRLFIYILLGLGIVSCQEKPKAKIDLQFQDDFYKKIDKLGTYCPKAVVDNDFIIHATYMYMITDRTPLCDYKSHSDFLNVPDTVIYSRLSYMQDKKFWYEWYNEHKYEVEFQFADSIYKVIEKKVLGDKMNTGDTTLLLPNEEKRLIDIDLLPGAYGMDEPGNAVFAIDESSIYYPDSDVRYQYELKGDTIQVIQDEGSMEITIIKELNQESLIVYYADYDITDTLIRRGANTGNEVVEVN